MKKKSQCDNYFEAFYRISFEALNKHEKYLVSFIYLYWTRFSVFLRMFASQRVFMHIGQSFCEDEQQRRFRIFREQGLQLRFHRELHLLFSTVPRKDHSCMSCR